MLWKLLHQDWFLWVRVAVILLLFVILLWHMQSRLGPRERVATRKELKEMARKRDQEQQHIAEEVAAGRLKPKHITEDMVSNSLFTGGLPDPDLVIRTSGEFRLSNFLLWQVAYAEIYITDIPRPEFRRPQLEEAFASFGDRERRFGKTGEQVQTGGRRA